jgi:hypothetical protein
VNRDVGQLQVRLVRNDVLKKMIYYELNNYVMGVIMIVTLKNLRLFLGRNYLNFNFDGHAKLERNS